MSVEITEEGKNAWASDIAGLKQEMGKKFLTLDKINLAVIVVLVVSVVTMLLMVVALILDSVRFNSMIYKEYSEKKVVNQYLISENESLQDEINSIKFEIASSSPSAD